MYNEKTLNCTLSCKIVRNDSRRFKCVQYRFTICIYFCYIHVIHIVFSSQREIDGGNLYNINKCMYKRLPNIGEN